ncbi:response regulator [Brevundimonas sp.]|uniref:response regulator n=1 Tax=Brevundimonas sp. TaxID=1871086 RepID=UPI003561EE6E
MPLTVMHIDDETDIREVAAFALELDSDLALISVGSGAEALAHLETGPAPDIILLDVMMPSMDGPSVLARLREIEGLEKTPVVFMTARAQSEEVERLKALGAIGVVVKPFDPMTLARQLRDILAAADA